MPKVEFASLKEGDRFIYVNGYGEKATVEVTKVAKLYAYLSNKRKISKQTGMIVNTGKNEKNWGDIWPAPSPERYPVDVAWKRLCLRVLKKYFNRPDIAVEEIQKAADILKLGKLL